jgi:SAM-dependent methyltransferase
VLLPACGTGRHAVALARRGLLVEASDISPEMLAIARARRAAPRLTYAEADMTRDLGAHADCDAAFTLCNSFRYILTDDDVAGHLAAVRARLRPGARYVVELALNPDAALVGGCTSWTTTYTNCRVQARWTLLSLTPPLSLERAHIRVEVDDGSVHDIAEDQPQRVWTAADLREHVARAGFRLEALHQADGAPAGDERRPGRYYAALRRLDEVTS